jgi:flavin reductase (DIM6/NTAB) family NADH-FMN oxidoreductase RutF
VDVQSGSPLAVNDQKLLRRTLGAFATGVTVVTVGGRAPHGMTANSFTSVSLDPPLVLVCVELGAVMHSCLPQAGAFAVSVLASHQEDVARHFADRRRPLGRKQFDVVDWLPGPHSGAPLIVGALAHVECDLWRSYDGGDHTIFVGAVRAMDRCDGDQGLLFMHGRFRHADERSDVAT